MAGGRRGRVGEREKVTEEKRGEKKGRNEGEVQRKEGCRVVF